MGFLRRLFGPKRAKDKKKRASSTEIPAHSDSAFGSSALDANKHAIAVAAATAAVAEAALAAAHAAAEVVRLTNGAGASSAAVTRSRYLAAVVIQSAFRGYLAKRALRALKALVKLQALVRGNIVRKQTADMLQRMQTLVRVQARARAGRTHLSESSKTSRKSALAPNHPFPESADRNGRQHRAHGIKYDGPSVLKRCGSNANYREAHKPDKPKTTAATGSNWLDRWMEESVWNDNDDKSDKILEVDTWKPHLDPQRSTRSFQMPRNVLSSDYHNPSFARFDSPSKRSTGRPPDESPRAYSVSSRPSSSGGCGGGGKRGPFTPAKSERSWGHLSAYSGYYPNYMANTESSRAKARSQSAPRQRVELESYGGGASKRSSAQGYWDGWTHSNVDGAEFRGSLVYPSFNDHMDRLASSTLR